MQRLSVPAFALCLVMPALLAQEPGDHGPIEKVVVQKAERFRLAALIERDAIRFVEDYDSFAVVGVYAPAFGGRDGLVRSGFELAERFDFVHANGYAIPTTRADLAFAAVEPSLRFGLSHDGLLDVEAGLYVVQFRGPVRDEWVDALVGLGATFLQPIPENAFVLSVPRELVALLDNIEALLPAVQFVSHWHPAYRLRPALRDLLATAPETAVAVTVQLVEGKDSEAAVDRLRGEALEYVQDYVVGPYRNVQLVLPAHRLLAWARHRAVFAIEARGERKKLDERQGQILAGNFAGASPSGPGYYAWLAAQGFNSTQFSTFAVNIVDDCMNPAGHPDIPSGRISFAQNPTSQTGGEAGHGFLNTQIVAGDNQLTGSIYEDALGYNYGAGIAPWARVGTTAIFGSGSATPTSYENNAYALGSRISSNSWGYGSIFGPLADYDANAQEYDFIARDARTGIAGNQEYLIVFAAGNDGPTTNTVASPGTAKNVLTVGASENDRQTGSDGCGISNTGANDIRDIISFSSRGPVNSGGGDGRWKPEIVAPGTHIQAGVPQSNYSGGGICNNFWPTGSTLYGWSSGTSHSTPAVAGGAALLYQRLINAGGAIPSPALAKAWLVNSPEYMTGVNANDTLPSNVQGMGRMNLGRALDSASRVLRDQATVFGATGAVHTVTGTIVDTSKPFRVTLAWTDAPGPTTGAPWINNLDLTVTVGATTYRGNVFSGANSIAGGSADTRNNLESVFLPAGTSGSFSVTVTATNIAGDGVPGNGDTTDQDFALVVYNGSEAAVAPTAAFVGTPTTGNAPLTIAFTDQSSGTVSSWAWDFGDGGTSTSQHPSHVYTAAGTYTVQLTVSGGAGSDVELKSGYITVNPPAPSSILYFSFTADTTLPGVGAVADEDIVSYDTGTGIWSMHVDLSDVGITGDIDAFAILANGDIAMSFDATTTVPGLSGGPSGTSVETADIVIFHPTATGAATAGSFAFHFDGSDVALTQSAENIDALFIDASGAIFLSTTGNPSVTGLSGVADEDVIRFTPTSTGSTTAGTWSYWFDGSDVALSQTAEDIDAICFDSAGRLMFSCTGAWSVAGAAGADEDIGRFTGTYGTATSGSFVLLYDISTIGVPTGANVDGFVIR